MPAAKPIEQVLLDNYRRCGTQTKQNLVKHALRQCGAPGSVGVACCGYATGGVSQSNVHGGNHFVAGDSATSVPARARKARGVT